MAALLQTGFQDHETECTEYLIAREIAVAVTGYGKNREETTLAREYRGFGGTGRISRIKRRLCHTEKLSVKKCGMIQWQWSSETFFAIDTFFAA